MTKNRVVRLKTINRRRVLTVEIVAGRLVVANATNLVTWLIDRFAAGALNARARRWSCNRDDYRCDNRATFLLLFCFSACLRASHNQKRRRSPTHRCFRTPL